MSKKISIIGCGWLGLPLAKHFIDKGFIVKGSTTSQDKIEILKSVGIDPHYIELTPTAIKGDIRSCLSDSDVLILNIPPGLRKEPEKNYVKELAFILPYIEQSSVKKVVFVSSTSVYADDISMPILTEASIPNPDSESGKQLLKAEALFQNNLNFKTTILRFAGLFGADRHPAKFLSGKTNLKNPKAPVNLIHRDDCISILFEIVNQDCWNEILNASTTPHPSRKDYYQSVCKQMDLPLPEFDSNSSSEGKQINSSKLIQLLNYEFQIKLNN